jgi:hypothetical protein
LSSSGRHMPILLISGAGIGVDTLA